jgi:hypothetical protein
VDKPHSCNSTKIKISEHVNRYEKPDLLYLHGADQQSISQLLAGQAGAITHGTHLSALRTWCDHSVPEFYNLKEDDS